MLTKEEPHPIGSAACHYCVLYYDLLQSAAADATLYANGLTFCLRCQRVSQHVTPNTSRILTWEAPLRALYARLISGDTMQEAAQFSVEFSLSITEIVLAGVLAGAARVRVTLHREIGLAAKAFPLFADAGRAKPKPGLDDLEKQAAEFELPLLYRSDLPGSGRRDVYFKAGGTRWLDNQRYDFGLVRDVFPLQRSA